MNMIAVQKEWNSNGDEDTTYLPEGYTIATTPFVIVSRLSLNHTVFTGSYTVDIRCSGTERGGLGTVRQHWAGSQMPRDVARMELQDRVRGVFDSLIVTFRVEDKSLSGECIKG